MHADDKKFSKQITVARQAMDKYRNALSALAGNEISPELQQQINAAREPLEKYRTAPRARSK